VHREKFIIIKQPDALISEICFGMKLYMFRTVPLFTIKSFSLYTQHWCTVKKLLMLDRGTVQNM